MDHIVRKIDALNIRTGDIDQILEPTGEVLVRCKDCEYCSYDEIETDKRFCTGVVFGIVDDYDFCSWAKIKK